MKVAMVFYSFSGNTKRACLFLKEKMAVSGIGADLFDLRLKEEVKSFFKQGRQAFFKEMPELIEADYNLDKYDFFIFASPIWAFTFAPALRSYLKKLAELGGKKTACFLTYGSGLGKGKALAELENVLREKKTHIFFSKDFPGVKSKDSTYLGEIFKPLFDILGL